MSDSEYSSTMTRRKLLLSSITSSSCPFLMLVFRINSFSMTKEKNEKEIGLFIKTRQDSTIRRKVTRKKKVKFTILLDGLVYSFVYFSLVI